MNKPKDMLVSDPIALARELFPMQNRMPSWAAGRQRARQETAERTIEKLRPIYEAELTKLRSEMDELVGFTARLLEYWDAGNFSRHVFHNELRDLVAKHKPE